MKKALTLIFICFLSACSHSSKIVYSDNNSVTVDHNFDMFSDAMSVAVNQCSSFNKSVKHESTSCQSGYHRCVSTFTCTPK